MALPPLTPEERSAASARSVAARQARSQLKARLKRGDVSLATVLAGARTDEVAGKIKVVSLLEALPGVGPVTARQVMERLQIAENRRARGLGPVQRAALEQEFAA